MPRARHLLLGLIFAFASACANGTPTTPTPTPSSQPAAPTPLSITTHPQSQTIDAGSTATLGVAANGSAPMTYQWYTGTTGTTADPISGATAASYTTPALTSTTSYWVRVSDAHGSADSATATVSVTPPPQPPPGPSPSPDPPPQPPPDPTPPPPTPPPPAPPPAVAPAITTQPESRSVTSGQSVTLWVQASGTEPLSYQWFVGASGSTTTPIGGATAASYTTSPLTQTTSFWVRVTNSAGTADSATATITVTGAETNAAFEEQVVVLVNQYRAAGATCGGTYYGPAPGLVMNAQLRAAARGHSEDMAVNNYFSHTSLDGRTFDQRIREAGYGGAYPWGENIAAGQSTPEEVVTGWMASPGHCTNIMSPGFKAIGVGYAFRSGSTYRHYWTQDFGGS